MTPGNITRGRTKKLLERVIPPHRITDRVDCSQELRLSFGVEGNAAAYTQAGWSNPEVGETWCIGQTSTLRLPVLAEGVPHILVLSIRPHIDPVGLPQQNMHVSVNGMPVATFSAGRRAVRACRIPVEATREGTLLVELRTPNAARPTGSGKRGQDTRSLAFAFSNLVLYPDHVPLSSGELALSSAASVPVDLESIMAADRIAVSELMLNFESLGQNCEFGLVQRQCRSEPLGLLRFSSTPLPKLLVALNNGFEGMGQPGSVDVVVSANGLEYMVEDRVFGFLYHAWVRTGEMSADDVRARETRRVPFLVRKLLEDLAEARKIFVFKGMSSLPEEEVFPLVAALRRYGPNTLLLVNLADATHRLGSVAAHAPGFLVGYIDRFAPTEDAGDLGLEHWVHVCREAFRLRTALSK